MFLSAKDMADQLNYQLAISTLKGTLENVRSQNIKACSCSHIGIRIRVPCLIFASFLLKPRLEGRYIYFSLFLIHHRGGVRSVCSYTLGTTITGMSAW